MQQPGPVPATIKLIGMQLRAQLGGGDLLPQNMVWGGRKLGNDWHRSPHGLFSLGSLSSHARPTEWSPMSALEAHISEYAIVRRQQFSSLGNDKGGEIRLPISAQRPFKCRCHTLHSAPFSSLTAGTGDFPRQSAMGSQAKILVAALANSTGCSFRTTKHRRGCGKEAPSELLPAEERIWVSVLRKTNLLMV